MQVSETEAARELLLRRRMRASVVEFAHAVPVPGRPVSEDEGAEFLPVETSLAAHHRLLLEALQRTIEKPHGRLMVFMPPGSAKSTYASVVLPSWAMCANPGRKVILACYGEDLARKHGRRSRQLLREPIVASTFGATISADSSAAQEFALSNGSEYLAAGILSGITGNRAHIIVIDDPIKGRAEADSEVVRQRTWEAYQDDLLTRLIPGGAVVLVQTRWHEDDLAGRLLPEDWAGQSGVIRCRDGLDWEVLCLQAKCAVQPDPLGREQGASLWPEWFDAQHWATFEGNARTWSALYQQIPAPAEGILFRRDDMVEFDKAPEVLRIVGASDYAATPDGGDWTEHGVMGIAADGTRYLLDWWRGQVSPEVWIEREIDLMQRWQPLKWFGETGPLRRATEGRLRQRMVERQTACALEWLPHGGADKPTKNQPAIAIAGMGRLMWPRNAAWKAELQRQCLVFPAGSPDDGVDTLGLLNRGADSLGVRQKNTLDFSTSAAAGARL
jgi:hypothetical protein